MVVLGGVAVSYEQGTPVGFLGINTGFRCECLPSAFTSPPRQGRLNNILYLFMLLFFSSLLLSSLELRDTKVYES